MAIDSSLFAGVIPAATYAAGDRVTLSCIRGPSIVRDGYGRAILKRVISLADSTTLAGYFKIVVKNSNWVDDLSNIALATSATETALAVNSAAIQQGQDVQCVPNSGWAVYAECINTVTTTAAADLFCLIDMDYPSVAAIEDPTKVIGNPVTIDGIYTITSTAVGAANAAVWNTFNVDIFKAGCKYLLTEAGFFGGASVLGFLSVSGAAGQAGLERIIPVRSSAASGLKYPIDYATPLVKGPMNLNILSFGTAATAYTYLDFVKKSV